MAKRRELNVFSMSFLDIMSCGFGAVILIFIIIHSTSTTVAPDITSVRMAEVSKLEQYLDEDRNRLVNLRNTLQKTEDETAATTRTTSELLEQIKEIERQIEELDDTSKATRDKINTIKAQLQELEAESESLKSSIAAQADQGTDVRAFAGEGSRQYLTGLNLGGQRILILLDTSTSMLDRTIVNIIRRRNFSDEQKLASKKWQRAIRTMDWFLSKLPIDVNFQVITFNTEATFVAPDSDGKWLNTNEPADLDAVANELKTLIPSGGTSLFNAFVAAQSMSPPPDNIFLIVDGLPTQGKEPSGLLQVDGRDRVRLFNKALEQLPGDVPINIVLFPMEGDPDASHSYWKLAFDTAGSILAPPDDWP